MLRVGNTQNETTAKITLQSSTTTNLLLIISVEFGEYIMHCVPSMIKNRNTETMYTVRNEA